MAFLGFALVVLLFAFWLVMLIDCATTKKLTKTEKLVWILVMIFLPVLGTLLYLVLTDKRAED